MAVADGAQGAEAARPLFGRRVAVDAWARADGLYTVEGVLVDRPGFAFDNGWRPPSAPGETLHEMSARLVVGPDFVVREVGASSLANPYPGFCEAATRAYGALVGARLDRGWRRAVEEAAPRRAACTHLTHLFLSLQPAAMVAIQLDLAAAGAADPRAQPLFIDGCTALRRDGAVVLNDHPQWSSPPGVG